MYTVVYYTTIPIANMSDIICNLEQRYTQKHWMRARHNPNRGIYFSSLPGKEDLSRNCGSESKSSTRHRPHTIRVWENLTLLWSPQPPIYSTHALVFNTGYASLLFPASPFRKIERNNVRLSIVGVSEAGNFESFNKIDQVTEEISEFRPFIENVLKLR